MVFCIHNSDISQVNPITSRRTINRQWNLNSYTLLHRTKQSFRLSLENLSYNVIRYDLASHIQMAKNHYQTQCHCLNNKLQRFLTSKWKAAVGLNLHLSQSEASSMIIGCAVKQCDSVMKNWKVQMDFSQRCSSKPNTGNTNGSFVRGISADLRILAFHFIKFILDVSCCLEWLWLLFVPSACWHLISKISLLIFHPIRTSMRLAKHTLIFVLLSAEKPN
jgi:hypothetical protein